jgi:hypothetical protein
MDAEPQRCNGCRLVYHLVISFTGAIQIKSDGALISTQFRNITLSFRDCAY